MLAGKLYSIASIFFGLISVVLSMIFFISFPAAILAITFGILAVKRYYRKSGTTAIVLGLTGVVITIVIFVNIVSALNVEGLISGNWNTENGGYINFTDRGVYVWYSDKDNKDDYSSGYYKLSTGIYKNGKKYTMGYTVEIKQLNYCVDGEINEEERTTKWLIYTPNKEVIDGRNKNYEMMNMETGSIVRIEKEKVKLFGIF